MNRKLGKKQVQRKKTVSEQYHVNLVN